MNRFGWLLFISSIYVTGCATSESNETTLYKEESNNGYCHKVFQPIGPTDLIRPTQSRAGDYISYSGPCDGATARIKPESKDVLSNFASAEISCPDEHC